MSADTVVSNKQDIDINKFRVDADGWFGHVLYDLNKDCDIFLDEKLVKDRKYEPFSFKATETTVFAITCMDIVVATVIFARNKDDKISDIDLVVPKIMDNRFNRTIFVNFLKHRKPEYEMRAKLSLGTLCAKKMQLNLTW
jgi:hypothetical protein